MCTRRGGEHANAGVILIIAERHDVGIIKRGPSKQGYAKLHTNPTFIARLWCGFTTPSFAVAYATSIESAPKVKYLGNIDAAHIV